MTLAVGVGGSFSRFDGLGLDAITNHEVLRLTLFGLPPGLPGLAKPLSRLLMDSQLGLMRSDMAVESSHEESGGGIRGVSLRSQRGQEVIGGGTLGRRTKG
jgi:hypothetical protein